MTDFPMTEIECTLDNPCDECIEEQEYWLACSPEEPCNECREELAAMQQLRELREQQNVN